MEFADWEVKFHVRDGNAVVVAVSSLSPALSKGEGEPLSD
jgi:hypothetical protein